MQFHIVTQQTANAGNGTVIEAANTATGCIIRTTIHGHHGPEFVNTLFVPGEQFKDGVFVKL